MTAPTLFDSDADLLSRTTDPDTSHEAALSQMENLSELQVIVLDLIRAAGGNGLTDSELCAEYARVSNLYGFPHVLFETPRRRRSDLARMGRIVDSGVRRLNPHNRNEVVWELAS